MDENDLGLNTLFGGNEDDFEDDYQNEQGYLQALHRIMDWEEDVEEDPLNNVETLNLSRLGLKTLPPLPKELLYLNCEDNMLETLPDPLPPGLLSLDCKNNQLTHLPETLPVSIFSIACDRNNLVRLPAVLPDQLSHINVDFNRLTELPATLPRELSMLSADDNLLTEIPELPSSTKMLIVGYNRLTRLPTLPEGLVMLTANNNLITEFPAAFPPGLKTMFLCRNPAPGMLAPLPVTLERLTACGLGMTALPSPLPPKLNMLRVSHNKLTSVPPLPATLTDVCFAHNYLTALPTPMPPNLKSISAVGNLLAWLPDEMPATVTDFWFDLNQLPYEEEGETLEHYLSEVKRLYAKYRARIIKRTNEVFEEMMASVWHPDRLVRLIDQYGETPQWNHDLQKYVPGFDFTALNEVL